MTSKKVHGRHGSRWLALQGLYAWVMTGNSLASIEADLVATDFQFNPQTLDIMPKISFDIAYVQELIHEIAARKSTLDDLMAPHLDRAQEELNTIEYAILLIALYELSERPEIPYKVVINEAILLAKQFGAQDSHKFVNGVLDKVAKVARSRELASA